MNIKLMEDKKIILDMKDDLLEAIIMFGEPLYGTATTPSQH